LISAPERASAGANSTPSPVASAGSPNFFDKDALAGTSLPLLQTALKVTITPNSPDPIVASSVTNSSGATLVYGAGDTIQLQVPALGNVGTPQTGYVGTIGLSLVPQTSVEAYPEFAYVLPGPGLWLVNSNNVATFSAFVTGLQTAFAGLPSAGSASYLGRSSGILFTPTRSAVLFGDAALTVNFASGAVNGSVTDVWGSDGNTADGRSNDVALSATLLSSGGFRGTADAGLPGASELSLNDTATGTVEGGFYGPEGVELGAVWTLSDGTKCRYRKHRRHVCAATDRRRSCRSITGVESLAGADRDN
jgi:hypothetical protein